MKLPSMALALVALLQTAAQHPDALTPGRFNQTGSFALTNVSVIDGTGGPVRRKQTIIVEGGLIAFVGDSAKAAIPRHSTVIDLTGRTVIPGLIMMHEHIADTRYGSWLFVANGVTTVRVAGAFRPFEEIALRRWIAEGRVPGPELFLSSPFISEHDENLVRHQFIVLRELRSEDDARAFVRYWAAEGFNAIKVYRGVTPAMLRVVIDEAHRHGLHVLGHLESTSCSEAAEAKIDSIEHNIGSCLDDIRDAQGKKIRDPEAPQLRALIKTLVKHNVAVTETPVDLRPMTQQELAVLHPGAQQEYRRMVAANELGPGSRSLQDDRQGKPGLTFAFVRAGGRVLLGSDSGKLNRLPGFMNLRSLVSLYSEYGFAPVEAVGIATLSAARFLKIDHRTGSVAAGKEADLVVIAGDPSVRMSDVRNIELVFTNGVRHDPLKLLEHVRGKYLRP